MKIYIFGIHEQMGNVKPKVLEQISYGETIAGDEESLESSPGEYKNLEVNKNLEGKRKERIWQGK